MSTLGSEITPFSNATTNTSAASPEENLVGPVNVNEGRRGLSGKRSRDLFHQSANGGSMLLVPAERGEWGQEASSGSSFPGSVSLLLSGSNRSSKLSLTQGEGGERVRTILTTANQEEAALLSPSTSEDCWRDEVNCPHLEKKPRSSPVQDTTDTGHEAQMGSMDDKACSQMAWLEDQKRKALDYEEEGDIMFARTLLQEALPLATKAVQDGLTDASYLGEFYAALANVCHQLGDVSDAIDHYSNSIKQERVVLARQLQESPSQLDRSHYSRLLQRLEAVCRVYVDVRQYRSALCVFKEIYDIHIDVTGSNSFEVATALCNIGLMYYLLQLYTPSLRFYQETLRISLTLLQYFKDAVNINAYTAEGGSPFPPTSPLALDVCVGDSLNAMGLLYFKLRRYDESASAFSCSLTIREKLLGPHHRDVTIIYYNLAMVRSEASDARLAIYLYHEGLRRDKVRLGDSYHPSLSSTLQCLAEIYSQIGELDDSLICFQQALEIECLMAIHLSSNTAVCAPRFAGHLSSICRLLNVIGNIHLMQANIPAALECFVQAARSAAKLVALGYPHIPLVVAGHVFCHVTRSQPPCAAAA